MSLGFTFSVTEAASGLLSRLRDELADSRGLNQVLSITVAEEVREHLRDGNTFRHATARRLGANPTGHLGKVARAVESGFDSAEAFVTIPAWSGMSRAFRDVTVTPKNGKKWLTIPANARAYGRSAREFDDLTFIPLGNNLAMLAVRAQSTREMVPMFWMKKEVTIRQDRSLLPSDEVLTAAAELAAGEWLAVVISNKGGLNS